MVPNLPLDRSTMTFLLLILEENLLISGAEIAKHLVKNNKLSIFVQNIIKKIIKRETNGFHPGGAWLFGVRSTGADGARKGARHRNCLVMAVFA